MQREIKRNSVRQKNVIKSGSYRIILPDKSYLCQLSTINYQLMKYLYTALILAFLCQGGATAQEKKSGFFDKVKNTFSSEIKIGTYTFKDNGAVYTGEIKGRKPNGKGKTVFKNGDVYEGEYVKGKREGYGTYMFPDGEKYEGQWFQDQQHGRGIYYFMNNNRYDGMWFQDYQHGKGTMYYYNGDIYEGDWVNDKREGQGTYTWKNGSKYVGSWKNDKKDGKGTLTWNDGSKYDGEWKNDVRDGKGTFEYANGDKYVGDWKDDMQHGKGIYFSIPATVTKVLMFKVNVPERAFITMPAATSMWAASRMESRKATAHLRGQAAPFTKVIGKITNVTDTVLTNGM